MSQVSQHQLAELLMSLSTTGLKEKTALFLAATEGTMRPFMTGANPHGKCAELVAMSMRNNLHDPSSPWAVVNPPSIPSNYVRSWVNPDPTSARDLLYEVRVSSTRHILVPGTQVKVGKPAYIARSLLSHAHDARYGKVCDIDARLVCPDGSPRVAADAFTKGQGESLKKAGFKFVGIEHLEQDAKRVHAGLKGAYEQELAAYERDLVIGASYAPRQVAFRAGITGGMSFILTAGVSSYQQYGYYKKAVRDGNIDNGSETRREYVKQAAKTVAKQASISGGITVASIAAEAAVFHVADKFMPSQKAKVAATATVAAGLASVDVVDEVIAYRRGEISGSEAAICGGIKIAADALPIVLQVVAGPGGSAIGSVVSTGIKWCLAYARNGLRTSIATDAA
jgi:hypothetical protein